MRLTALIGAAALLVMIWTASAHAAPLGQIGEFKIPTEESGPNGIAIGPEGNVWFTEFGPPKHGEPCPSCPSRIGELNPSKPTEIHEYEPPTHKSGPFEITAAPDGNLWFTEFNVGKIGEINPRTHEIEEYAIPPIVPAEVSHPFGITAGREGNVWFTIASTEKGGEENESYIGEINTGTHVIKRFGTPSIMSFPTGITAGPEGHLWFTEGEAELGAGRIGEINPTTGESQDFAFKTSGAHFPGEITLGHEGNLWFTELFRNQIGVINPKTHEIEEFVAAGVPLGITTGREGYIWFTEIEGNTVARLNPSNPKEIEGFELAKGSGPSGITAGKEGNLWFAEHAGGEIGTIGAGPKVTTVPASAIKATSATLNASVTPEGSEVLNCKFEYGTKLPYTASVPCSTQPGSGTSPVAVSAALTGLRAATTYHFRISATTLGGTSVGGDRTLETASTCGKTSVGARSDRFIADRKRVNRCELATAGKVSELSVYLLKTSTAGEQLIKGIIYADSHGAPGALLGETEELAFKSNRATGWYHLAFAKPVQLVAGQYWIGVISGQASVVTGYRYDTVAGARDLNANAYSSGPSNPFGSFTQDSQQMSLYATYTTG